jgi:hypothetical protein
MVNKDLELLNSLPSSITSCKNSGIHCILTSSISNLNLSGHLKAGGKEMDRDLNKNA